MISSDDKSIWDEPVQTTEKSAPDLHTTSESGPHDDVTRALPHAIGPEKSVLSSMLHDPENYIPAAIEQGVTAEHFYLPAHATIFREIVSLADRMADIELVSFVQHLLDKGLLDQVGGPSALSDLYTYSPSDGWFSRYVTMIHEKRILRSVIEVSNEAITGAYENPERALDLVDVIESRLSDVREDRITSSSIRTAGDEVDFIVEEFADIAKGVKRGMSGIPTGFEMLDDMLGGMNAGNMYVIAARPSVGKTSLMMNIVEHVSFQHEKPCLVFSMEMMRRTVVQRLMYSRARIPMADLHRERKFTKGELLRFQEAAFETKRVPIWIDDRSGLTIQEIRAKTRRLHRQGKAEFLAVDYLQLARSRSKQANNSREREVSEVSAGLKDIGKELGIPVLVLAQLNRDVEKRNGSAKGIPRMSDLRESGSIEQDADAIGLLYRKDYSADTQEEKDACAGEAGLVLAKNRNGATGMVPLTFIADLMRFESGNPAQEPKHEQPALPSRYD